ncbi:MAG: C39 family peptidase [Paludibacter sp.]
MKKRLLFFIASVLFSTQLFSGIINVPAFRQDGASWGANTLGTCTGCSLTTDGCAITCVAMLLKANGVNVDPGLLNTYLKNNSGYAYNPSGCTGNCIIYWAVPTAYTGSSMTYPNLSTTFNLATVKSEIDNGNPVILQTKSGSITHYVVIKGYNNSGTSTSDFVVVDPLKTGDQVLTNYSTDEVRIYHNVSVTNPPTLSNPTDNFQITKSNNSISFSWSSVTNAVYYEIWIDNNIGFGSPEIGFNNGASSTWLTDGIVSTNGFALTSAWQNQLPQNVYYWKVRALNASKVAITDWSTPTRNFSLLDPIPPTLSSPADNSQFTKSNNNSIPFSWSSVTNAVYYEIWIDNNIGFGSPEIGFKNGASSTWLTDGIVSTNVFALTSAWQNQLPQNVYYWKVRALNASKVAITDWSSPTIKFSLLNDISGVSRILGESNFLNIYPTSSYDKIIIETDELIKEATVVIYNTKGQEIVRQTITNSKTQIDISKLPSSTYLVKLINYNKAEVKTFIKI